MVSKCFRRSCNFVQECAHMDEAVDVLRQHFRAVHPTKGFYDNRAKEELESFNLDADEVLEQYNIGTRENPQTDWHGVRRHVQRSRDPRYDNSYINEETLVEVERRLAEYDAANPQPQAEAPANPARVIFDAFNGGAPAAAVPPFDAQAEDVVELVEDIGPGF